jgi:hypothetical protein
MITADALGIIKYWQTNMNNVKELKDSHKEPVNDITSVFPQFDSNTS